jgi:T5SS/PEP-CTERM-associated repeat protein
MTKSTLVAFTSSFAGPCSVGPLVLVWLVLVFASPSSAQMCTPTQSGAVTEILSGIRVGDGGVGTYGLDGAVCNESFNFLTAGFSNNGDGTVLLENGASLTLLNNLDVAQVGTGLVSVESGSQVTVSDCRVSYRDGDAGSNASGSGTLIVTGVSSQITCTDELQVGTDGMGVLELSNGAQMTALRTGLTGFESNAFGEIRVFSGASLDITGSNGSTHIVGVRGSGRLDIDGGSLSFSSGAAGTLTTCTVGGCDVEVRVANGGLLLAQFIFANNDTLVTLEGGTIETQQNLLRLDGSSMLQGSGTIVGDVDNRRAVFPGIDGIGQIDIVSDDAFDGNFTNSSAASIEFEIAAEGFFDAITVDGDLSFDGNVDIAFIDSYVPAPETNFEIISVGGGITWSPNSVDITGLPALVLAETTVVEEAGAIVVKVPEPGSGVMALAALMTCGGIVRVRRGRG